jgi:DmsE family decaheme c-type cytochrome
MSFAKGKGAEVQKQNAVCLTCHRDNKRMAWDSSAHQRQGLACTDCHTLHTRNDAALSRKAQAGLCLDCHNKQRAEFARTSAHPVRHGKINCSDCHNPHGTLDDSMLLVSGTKNMTCYNCHAEKRGPFLWAHAPVAEDCGICHEHHGAINTPLLKKRQPLLCQQCHSQPNHPSDRYDGGSLTNTDQSKYILGKSCLNCHSQVHGSNHPSGAKLLR